MPRAASPRRKSVSQATKESGNWSKFFLPARAYFVHFYTASTVVTHILAMQAIFTNHFDIALIWMGVAVLIDATDGTLARRWNVKKYAAGTDGRRLDDIIDFISFAFLPMVFLVKAELIMQPAWLFASLPLIASAFGFGRVAAKLDDDGFFIGFPSYWNIVVYYMWQLQSSVLINTIALLILSAMVFIPSRYVYPTRYPKAQWLHLIGSYGMGAAMLTSLFIRDALTKERLLYASLVYPVFYAAVSFFEEYKARTKQV